MSDHEDERTIAENTVLSKYKMTGDIVNRKISIFYKLQFRYKFYLIGIQTNKIIKTDFFLYI